MWVVSFGHWHCQWLDDHQFSHWRWHTWADNVKRFTKATCSLEQVYLEREEERISMSSYIHQYHYTFITYTHVNYVTHFLSDNHHLCIISQNNVWENKRVYLNHHTQLRIHIRDSMKCVHYQSTRIIKRVM